MRKICVEDVSVISGIEVFGAVELGRKNLQNCFNGIYESATSEEYKNLMKFELLVDSYYSFKRDLSPFDGGLSGEVSDVDVMAVRDLFLRLISQQAFIQGISTDLIGRVSPVLLIVDNRELFDNFNSIMDGSVVEDSDLAYGEFLGKCQFDTDERLYNLLDIICDWGVNSFMLSEKLDASLKHCSLDAQLSYC